MTLADRLLSFPVMLAVFAIVTVVLVAWATASGQIALVPFILLTLIVLGLLYLALDYLRRPRARTEEAPAPREEAFADPVEEADRLGSLSASAAVPGSELEPPPPPVPEIDHDDADDELVRDHP